MKRKFVILLMILSLVGVVGVTLAQDTEREVITTDNAANLSELIRLGRGTADYIAWSPDGANLLVGGTLGVWLYDSTALDTMNEPPLANPGGEVTHFDISPDGATLAISHSDESFVQFHDAATGELVTTYEGEVSAGQLAYSSDGAFLSINGSSNGIEIYDVANSTLYTTVEASLDSSVSVLFSPDVTQIVAATRSNTLAAWDFINGGDPMEFAGHTSTINDMTYSPDGTLIASASSDDSVRIWNAADATEIAVITQATADDTISDAYAVAFSPDGSQLLTGHSGSLRFWDVAAGADAEGTGTQTSMIDVVGTVEDIIFSPDGSQFAIVTSNDPTAVQLYNADGTLVATSVGHNAYVNAITFSPSSDTLTFGDQDSFLYLWDTATVEEITFNTKVEDGVTSGVDNKSNITYTSDGQYMATLQSFSVTLRDVETGEMIREYDAEGISEDIEFSPDNTMLAVVTSQGFYVFNVESGALLYSNEDANDWMEDVTWSADQTMISTVSGDHGVRVYTVGG